MGCNIHSWKEIKDSQQIIFEDLEAKNLVKAKLSILPNIVCFSEITNLNFQLNALKNNNNFIIHLGECSESFANFSYEYVTGYNNLFNEIVTKIPQKNIIKIARLAGQFAKPRSKLFETFNQQVLNAYRGDLINASESCSEKRIPNINRWLEAYSQATITKSLIAKDIFISHESLVLEYEENFIKQNLNDFYSSSAHLLWVGKRTAFLNSAQIEFVRNLVNPIAFKINHENIGAVEELINSRGLEKKTILIGRFGVSQIEENLKLLEKILKKYPNIIYLCDPMHGNTDSNGEQKFRLISAIENELIITINFFKQQNLKLDGLMLEATHENVLECVNDTTEINPKKYKSSLDPRLNYKQTIQIIELLNKII